MHHVPEAASTRECFANRACESPQARSLRIAWSWTPAIVTLTQQINGAFLNIFGAGFTGAATGAQSAVTEVELNLGPLQFNGGPTMTHALLPGSVAIDRGLTALDVKTDQRGSARAVDDPAAPNASGGDGSESAPTSGRRAKAAMARRHHCRQPP